MQPTSRWCVRVQQTPRARIEHRRLTTVQRVTMWYDGCGRRRYIQRYQGARKGEKPREPAGETPTPHEPPHSTHKKKREALLIDWSRRLAPLHAAIVASPFDIYTHGSPSLTGALCMEAKRESETTGNDDPPPPPPAASAAPASLLTPAPLRPFFPPLLPFGFLFSPPTIANTVGLL